MVKSSSTPPPPPSIPSWELALVLWALQIAPFEPLQSADLKILSTKTLLLVALTSVKRVGDLLAFSVYESCLEFGLGDGHVVLRLCAQDSFHSLQGPGFRDQVVSLQALPLEEADPALALLCLVRALQLCIERSPWFTQAQGMPCPLRLHAHSTRGVTSSWALAHGASLTDICRATGLGDT